MPDPANISTAMRIALLSNEEREEVLEGMDLALLPYDWEFWRRPDQVIPVPNELTTIVFSGGRGSGKTRTESEWIRHKAKSMPNSRGLLAARTAADARDVLVNGDSGVLSVHPPSEMPIYEPSKRLLTWPNGTIAQLYCATEDTEVLTKRGWMKHDQLVSDDQVWTLNVEQDAGEWCPLERVNVFDVEDEPLITVDMNMFSTAVTVGHRWPVRNKSNRKIKWKESLLDFNTKDAVILASAQLEKDEPSPSISDSFVELMGWFTTEGHARYVTEQLATDVCVDVDGYRKYVENRRAYLGWTYAQVGSSIGWNSDRVRRAMHVPPKYHDIRMTLARALGLRDIEQFFASRVKRFTGTIVQSTDKNSDNVSSIRQALKSTWPEVRSLRYITEPAWKETTSGHLTVFVLSHEAVQELSKNCVGDFRDKVVSLDFVLRMTSAQRDLFLRVMIDGDGTWTNGGSRTAVISQKVQGRLDAIELAAVLSGWSVRRRKEYNTLLMSQAPVMVKPGGGPWSERARVLYEQHVLSLNKQALREDLCPISNGNDRRRMTEYTGKVWCPTTRNGTWFARRRGAMYFTGNSSETPDSLRGPQGHWGAAEELATWYTIPDDSGLTAWDNLQIAVRLGELPQIMVATTPKRTQVMRALYARAAHDARVLLIHSTTRDNAGNLSEVYLDLIYGKYKGTSLAMQELEGLLMDEVEGALWSSDVLDRTRVESLPRDVDAFVVSVDPSVSENKGDLAGITLIGSTMERRAQDRSIYVVEDASLQGTPKEWVEKAVSLAQTYECGIVIEKNQGGRLLTDAIHSVDHRIKVHSVQARASKQLRAEPVVLSFERGQTHLVGEHPMLEAEMLSWVPDLKMKSPDRIDALVYGVSYFLADANRGGYRPRSRGTLTTVGNRRLPQSRFGIRSRGW